MEALGDERFWGKIVIVGEGMGTEAGFQKLHRNQIFFFQLTKTFTKESFYMPFKNFNGIVVRSIGLESDVVSDLPFKII